ncbi:MAG: hypothetical protein L3J79_07890, partial [Candidatus Marinimicrobia bacterium]|nr:hypothetical protein [Candidatus Neomarinimicrobiota bacterium]
MSIPLREIEQHFRELQYYLRNGLASRVKLDLINQFFSNLGAQEFPQRYLSYFQEIYEDFLGLLEPENLQFRSTGFLADVGKLVEVMQQAGLNEVSDPDYQKYHDNLRYQQIATCCYTADQSGLELLTGIKTQYESGVDPPDVLSKILCASEFKGHKNIEVLEKISQNWQTDALGWSQKTVWIPLVEQETTQNFGKIVLATLQPLSVDVEQRRQAADMDLIFFNNHPLSVGDPVYDQALDAVGAAKMHLKIRKPGKIPKFRIMFGFPDKQYFY